MSSPFRNVALLGATGGVGSRILRSLSGAGFTVTAIQRKESTNGLPEGIKSISADLTNKADLVAAFKDQDVVVSAVPIPSFNDQKVMLDAAAEAGIKRVIPSEYSSNLELKGKELRLPNIAEKLKTREYVEELAAAGKIEWSSIQTGPFFDLGVQLGFLGPNIKTKTALFHDGGDVACCTTSRDDIAEAVKLVLQHPEETNNKPVYVYSALVTERQVTDIVSKLTGIQFEIKHTSAQKDADAYFEAVKKGENDPHMRFNLYFLMMYGAGFGGNYTDVAMNKTIGLKVMDDAEIERNIGDWLEAAGVEVRR